MYNYKSSLLMGDSLGFSTKSDAHLIAGQLYFSSIDGTQYEIPDMAGRKRAVTLEAVACPEN